MASNVGMLRSPFSRYWASTVLADFGDGIRMAAFPLLAVELTRSPTAVAAVTAVQGLPWLLAGLGVGPVVDRRNLRTVMIVVDVLRAGLIVALAVAVMAGLVSLPLLYLTAFATGIGSMVRDIAASTAVPRLVDHDELETANGRLVVGSLVGGELAGPSIGGWLFGIAAALPFALNAGGLGIAVLLLLSLPSVFAPTPGPAGADGTRRGFAPDLVTGLRWLWRDRPLRNLVLAVFLVFLADGAFLAMMALYVIDVLRQAPAVYGLLLGVGALGGIAAGAGCGALTRRFGVRAVLGLSTTTMAAAQLAIGLTGSLLVAGVALAASSAAFAMFNVLSRSLRQRRTPAWVLGRVNSTYLTVVRGAEACGALLGGGLAAITSIQTPILVGALALLAATAWSARSDRSAQ